MDGKVTFNGAGGGRSCSRLRICQPSWETIAVVPGLGFLQAMQLLSTILLLSRQVSQVQEPGAGARRQL